MTRLVRWVGIFSLALLGGGCQPDRVAIGGGVRQVTASAGGNKLKLLVPVYEVELAEEIRKSSEAYLQLQFAEFSPGTAMVSGGEVRGQAQSFGAGLRWYPFTDTKLGQAIGVGVTGEIFRADYTIEGIYARVIKYQVSDRLWGYGLTPGLVGELALDEKRRWLVTWHVGWSFHGDCDSEFNLDGGLDLGLSLRAELGE